MPINVFGNSSPSYDNGKKIDTSLIEQKPHLRNNYTESDIEEDIGLKNQYRIKNLSDPISIKEAVSKNYVDKKIDLPSLVRNNKDNDFNNHNITNINSNTLNTKAVSDNQVTTKSYVDQFHQGNERSRRDLGLDF